MSPRLEKSRTQKILMSSIQQTYPLAITDLAKDQLDLLIGALNINNTYPEEYKGISPEDALVKEAIKKLPWNLRRHAFIRVVPNAIVKPAILCEPHNGLNPYVINHVFTLIKHEVTAHLKCLQLYTGELDPEIRQLLIELKGMRGLWRSDPKFKAYLKHMDASHQHSRCEACILVQVIDTPGWLQNLRTTILSRTRTRAKSGKPHRAPHLLRFIDGAINAHSELITELYYRSGQKAYSLKAARKLALKEYRQFHRGKDRDDGKSEDEDNPGDNYMKHETIFVYWDQVRGGHAETVSSRTAVETSSSKTAVNDTDELPAKDGKTTPRKLTPSEALLEEIIAEYAGLTGTEEMEDARDSLLEMQPDLAPPTPLSITKPGMRKSLSVCPASLLATEPDLTPPTPLAITKPGMKNRSSVSTVRLDGVTETHRLSLKIPVSRTGERKSKCSSARDNVDWSKVIHKRSPLDDLSARASAAYHEISETAEEIAVEYRDLLNSEISTAYSDSEYSVVTPVDESGRPPTTWELLCDDLDIETPCPPPKDTKKKKGLLRKFSWKK